MVPPFAGLVGLGAVRTFVPMGLASALWYGGITLLGAFIGAEWGRIMALISRVNRTLGSPLGFASSASLSGDRWWHGDGAGSGCGMPRKDALDPAAPSFLAGTDIAEGSARQAAALLVLELAYADPVLTPTDREAVAAHLRSNWGVADVAPPSTPALTEETRRTHFAGYARRLRQDVSRAQRVELVERLWTVAFSDGTIGKHENRLMHLAGELLGIGPTELADVRQRLREQRPS